jgi:hypothetical protein
MRGSFDRAGIFALLFKKKDLDPLIKCYNNQAILGNAVKKDS